MTCPIQNTKHGRATKILADLLALAIVVVTFWIKLIEAAIVALVLTLPIWCIAYVVVRTILG